MARGRRGGTRVTRRKASASEAESAAPAPAPAHDSSADDDVPISQLQAQATETKDDDSDDERDAKNVLDVLENEVLPAWDEGDEKWCELMRASIATSARFTGARMISDYRRFYDSFE